MIRIYCIITKKTPQHLIIRETVESFNAIQSLLLHATTDNVEKFSCDS